MGTKLARDGNAASARVAEKPDAAGRTQVLAVNASAAELGQQDVAHNNAHLDCSWPSRQPKDRTPVALVHDTVAYQIIILAMVEHGEIKHPGIFDRTSHQLVILYAMAVVGNGNDPGLCHRSDRGHLLTDQTSCGRTGS